MTGARFVDLQNLKWEDVQHSKEYYIRFTQRKARVDHAGNNRFVFNIKGNHYRLIASVIFAWQKVYIRFIGTHKEYDTIDDYSEV